MIILSVFILLIVIYALVKGVNHNLLALILIVTGVNVLLTEVLIGYKMSFKLNTNLYFILNSILWIQIIIQYFSRKSAYIINFCLGVFIIYSLYQNSIVNNVLYSYFVVTSILYIFLFFLLSIRSLKEENITFFQSLDFTLIFAPILFFLGMSFIFGFESTIFSKTYIFKGVKDDSLKCPNAFNFKCLTVYEIIAIIVNIVYYSLIGYFAFKSKRQ